jgi:hypothetical protein
MPSMATKLTLVESAMVTSEVVAMWRCGGAVA